MGPGLFFEHDIGTIFIKQKKSFRDLDIIRDDGGDRLVEP